MPALDNSKTTTLRAAFIRKRLSARHDEGTALRKRLDAMSDADLVRLEDTETAATIAHLEQKHRCAAPIKV
jgi:hypothetical protein